ncbi:hypothetical protein P43SY_011498 [Pythium insidiosum]|uniref:Uncharacterized protein n=1 Tax=Pythium insidiosum TaxID=114742 RepID=A0AAD5L6Q4_PYTIN|nr:hypothetical protein P43SY_011498 [Pythium insidiosum]
MPSDAPHAPAGSLPDDMPVDPQSGDTHPESSDVAASGADDGADGAQPGDDAARERLALGRRLLDQRLTDLFTATAGSVTRPRRHLDFHVDSPSVGDEGDFDIGDAGGDDEVATGNGDDDVVRARDVSTPASMSVSPNIPPFASVQTPTIVIDVDAEPSPSPGVGGEDLSSPRGVKRPSASNASAGTSNTTGAAVSGGPLTFTGSGDAALVANYTAVPAAAPGAALTVSVFPPVAIPFALGNVRGRSSVLQFSSLDEIHTRSRFNVVMQRVRGGQTPFFPNYAPVRSAGESQLACYGPNGFASMARLLDRRPWDAMWRGRVRHVFLFDPNRLDAAQVDWIHQVLRFMYRYRRHYLQRQHWFPLSRQPSAPSAITSAYATREASDRELVMAFMALVDAAPPVAKAVY